MKFRLTGDGNMEAFNTTLVTQCYSLAECDITALRAKGMSWKDICTVANAAVRTGQTVMQIAELRGQGMTWEQIACKFNVAPSDICKPVGMRSLAMVTPTPVGSGPVTCPMNVRDSSGNIIMTEDMADRWYRRGYDWLDVAVATNISLQTNIPVMEILIQLNAGHTWRDLAYYFGVCPEVAFNVCNWPFPRRTIYSQSISAKNMRMIEKYQNPTQMAGAGPYRAPMSYWLLQRGTWFGNDWCRACGTPCPAPRPAPCPTN